MSYDSWKTSIDESNFKYEIKSRLALLLKNDFVSSLCDWPKCKNEALYLIKVGETSERTGGDGVPFLFCEDHSDSQSVFEHFFRNLEGGDSND